MEQEALLEMNEFDREEILALSSTSLNPPVSDVFESLQVNASHWAKQYQEFRARHALLFKRAWFMARVFFVLGFIPLLQGVSYALGWWCGRNLILPKVLGAKQT